ncbi:DNA repair protein xrcc4-like isoform X2 [Agrilus planipennis]|uniref:DNA repair protein xrcc4-like isoform X2 n=1 Tax=Agrilus planipennis TaxID=224129 RepID=A0A7F5RCS4_AGRPL|nr:DNA repair protein xrcc4-like isoform X2 [Agrilus planipennis]
MSTEKLFTTQINGNPSKLKICWCDNYFQLTILEADSAWTAMIPKDKLPEIAIQLDQDCESYNKALYSYLFNPEDSTNISFAVQNKSFIIHKQIEGGFRVKFFYTPLEKKEYHNCAEELLDELLTKNSFYENQISSLQQLLEKEIKERTSISEKYEEFQKDIENKEKTLYSSFVLLLNEKKKRIQYLTELLDSNRNSDLSVNDNKVVSKKEKENEGDSDLESNDSAQNSSKESAYDTDEEKDNKIKSLHKSSSIHEPSSSKNDVVSLFQDYSHTVVLPPKRRKNGNEDTTDIEEHNSFKLNVYDAKTQPFEVNPIKDEEESPIEFGTQDILDRM